VFEYFPPLLLTLSQRFYGALALHGEKSCRPDCRDADSRIDPGLSRQKIGNHHKANAPGGDEDDA
jgi:hypothetical protein